MRQMCVWARRRASSLVIGALIGGMLSIPMAQADCIDYADYLHWVGSANFLDDFDVAFSVGGISIVGDYAYVAAGQYGFRVIDITDRIHPCAVASLPQTGVSHDVKVQGNFAYVAGTVESFHCGILVIDISQPRNPRIVGRVATGDARGLAIDGHYAYVANWSFGVGLSVVDIADPQAPVVIATVEPGYASGVIVTGGFAYVAGEDLRIIDVSDPTHPSVVGNLDTPGSTRSLAVSRNSVLVRVTYRDAHDGLVIIDSSTPEHPQVASSLDLNYGVWGGGIVADGDVVYLSAGGLVTVDISDPKHPTVLGHGYCGSADSIAISGCYAYVADRMGLIHVIDVTSPYEPPFIGSAATAKCPYGVAVANDRAYVAVRSSWWPWNGGLEVFDIADPSHPKVIGAVAVPTRAKEVAAVGDLAFVVCQDSLVVVDASAPRHPRIIGSFRIGANAIAISGDYAILVHPWWLVIIDISNPCIPTETARLALEPGAMDVAVVGRKAYITGQFVTLQIVDLSDPYRPLVIGTATHADGSPLAVCGQHVAVAGNRAYVVDYDGRLLMIDVTNTDHAVEIATMAFRQDTNLTLGSEVLVADEDLYFGSIGLQVVDLSGVHVQPYPLRMTGDAWIGKVYGAAMTDDCVFMTVQFGLYENALIALPRQCGHLTSSAGQDSHGPSARLALRPNPFNPRTTISYTLESPGRVTLDIFDARGMEVVRLSEGVLSAGVYAVEWQGNDRYGRPLPSGTYFCRLTTPWGTETRKMGLVR